MSDIATLGIAIDSTSVKSGSADLDKLTEASARAEVATDKLSTTTQRAAVTAQSNNSATQAMAEAINKAEASATRAAAAGDSFVAAQNREYAARTRSALAAKEQELATEAAAAAVRASAAEYARLETEIEKLTASSSRAASAQALIGKAQETLNAGVERGVITQQAAATVLEGLNQKYGAVSEGAAKATVSTGFVTKEIRALGDEISSGRYRQADGTFANLATRVLGLSGAALGAIGGVVALGVAIAVVVARAEELDKAARLIQTGFASTGNTASLTEKQIKQYIVTLALLPGVSRDSSEKAIAELARVPGITGPLFDQSTKILGDFAARLGTDVPTAAKTLASSLADPAKGAATLQEKFTFLTSSQLLAIDAFSKTGDKSSALKILIDSLSDSVSGFGDKSLTPTARRANELGVAWQQLLDKFSDPTGFNTAGASIANVLTRLTVLVNFIRDHAVGIGTFFLNLAGAVPVAGLAVKAAQLAASPTSDDRSVTGRLDGPSVGLNPVQTPAEVNPFGTATTSAQSQSDQALFERNKGVESRASRIAQMVADETRFKEILADENKQLAQGNLSTEQRATLEKARAETLSKIAGIQEGIEKKTPKTPLGLNVDTAGLEQQLKALDAASATEKGLLSERQKYIDFYHKVGITSDDEYNKSKDAANNEYLATLQANYAKEIAAVEEHEAALKARRGANPAQTNDLNAAIIRDQTKINELKSKEAEITAQITNDNKFRADTAGIIKAQEDFNAALKQTQELQSDVSEVTTRVGLEVQLGLKTQLEGTLAVTAARQDTIAKLQAQLAVMQQIHDTEGLDPASPKYIEEAKAIDKVNIALLQMKTELDPVGKALNQAFSQDLDNFFDKFATGGIKTFKDLKSAALDFFGSIASQIAKQANSELSGNILKSLGAQTDSATGGAGGLGGYVSRALGYSGSSGGASSSTAASGGSAANDDPMGDFIKNIDSANDKLATLSSGDGGLTGAIKGVAGYVAKQLLGTTTQVTATSATSGAATALTALTNAAYGAATALGSGSGGGGGGGSLGGLGSLFGGGSAASGASAGGSVATASQVAQADSLAANASSLSASGVTPFLHGGGIVGRDFAFQRHMSFTQAEVNAAPRFHGGGIAGLSGYEQLAVLKKGEEVLTDDDPRHQSNGGRSRGGVRVTNNFTIQPTQTRSSQLQIAQRAGAAVNAAQRR